MDLNTLVWIVDTCLVVQQYHDDQLLTPRTENNGQGTVEPQSKFHVEVKESKAHFCLKQLVEEELRAQCVFVALAQDFGKLEA